MMKYGAWIVVTAVTLWAGGVEVLHRFDTALHRAASERKEIIMIYSAPWCPECNYMKEVVFRNPKVAEYLRRRFIMLELNVQKDDLPKGFSYRGIPTFFFLDGKGKLRGKIVCGSKPDLFLKRLKAIP